MYLFLAGYGLFLGDQTGEIVAYSGVDSEVCSVPVYLNRPMRTDHPVQIFTDARFGIEELSSDEQAHIARGLRAWNGEDYSGLNAGIEFGIERLPDGQIGQMVFGDPGRTTTVIRYPMLLDWMAIEYQPDNPFSGSANPNPLRSWAETLFSAPLAQFEHRGACGEAVQDLDADIILNKQRTTREIGTSGGVEFVTTTSSQESTPFQSLEQQSNDIEQYHYIGALVAHEMGHVIGVNHSDWGTWAIMANGSGQEAGDGRLVGTDEEPVRLWPRDYANLSTRVPNQASGSYNVVVSNQYSPIPHEVNRDGTTNGWHHDQKVTVCTNNANRLAPHSLPRPQLLLTSAPMDHLGLFRLPRALDVEGEYCLVEGHYLPSRTSPASGQGGGYVVSDSIPIDPSEPQPEYCAERPQQDRTLQVSGGRGSDQVRAHDIPESISAPDGSYILRYCAFPSDELTNEVSERDNCVFSSEPIVQVRTCDFGEM